MRAGNQAKMKRVLTAHARAKSHLYWIDLAHHVGELCAWRQALRVAIFTPPPRDWNFVRRRVGQHGAAHVRDGLGGIFVNRATWNIHVWKLRVKKSNQRAHEPTLALTLLAKEQHVVARDHGVDNFWQHGVFIAHNAWEKIFFGRQHARHVFAQLFFHAAAAPARLHQRGKCAGQICGGSGGCGCCHWCGACVHVQWIKYNA